MLSPISTVIATGSFREFVVAVSRAKLPYSLDGTRPCTVIVPTDAAFARLPSAVKNILSNNPANWRHLIGRHILPKQLTLSEMLRLRTVKTINNASLQITLNHAIYVDGARVIQSDLLARNGMIHIIDQVIIPAEFLIMLNQSQAPTLAMTSQAF